MRNFEVIRAFSLLHITANEMGPIAYKSEEIFDYEWYKKWKKSAKQARDKNMELVRDRDENKKVTETKTASWNLEHNWAEKTNAQINCGAMD